MTTVTMEERLARLEAIAEIKALKARYCAYCDDDYDPEGIANLFVPDGVWDGGPEFGSCVGREELKQFFSRVPDQIRFAAHLVLNPIIDVKDADHATGKWRLLMPATVVSDGGAPESRWLLCEYDEEYLRRDGCWMFKSLKLEVNFYAPHLKGWA